MSDVAVDVRWEQDLRFRATGQAGVPVVVDGDSGAGPSPVESLLIALASCMGADVVEILGKMRVPFTGVQVRAEGDRRPDPPRRYTAVRLVYQVDGVPADDRSKLERAVDLSRDTYCSVLHTLQPDLDLEITVETA